MTFKVFSSSDMSAARRLLRTYLSWYSLVWDLLCAGHCVSSGDVKSIRHDHEEDMGMRIANPGITRARTKK